MLAQNRNAPITIYKKITVGYSYSIIHNQYLPMEGNITSMLASIMDHVTQIDVTMHDRFDAIEERIAQIQRGLTIVDAAVEELQQTTDAAYDVLQQKHRAS